MEQYNRCNNVKMSWISNEVSDQNLEETVLGICKDPRIDVNPLYIEGCHRLPLGRNATNTTKRVIVKFINRKHAEAMLSIKRTLTRKIRCLLAICCVLIIEFCGESAKNCREKVGLTKYSVLELSSR